MTAEDGRAVLEVIYAAYLSAGTGKAIDLPLADDISVQQPIDLWLGKALPGKRVVVTRATQAIAPTTVHWGSFQM